MEIAIVHDTATGEARFYYTTKLPKDILEAYKASSRYTITYVSVAVASMLGLIIS